MHGAPSVSYPVGRSAFAGGFAALLWLLGGAVLAAWHLSTAASAWRHVLGLAVWLAAGACAVREWRRSPLGELAWDGAAWQFAGAEAQAPHVALDLQRRMLLRVAVGGRRHWLWVERVSAPSYWEPLRRAVYSRRPPAP